MRDARTIRPEELFERRVQAVKLHKKGLTHLSIADIVGVHRNTVGEWIKVWKLLPRHLIRLHNVELYKQFLPIITLL